MMEPKPRGERLSVFAGALHYANLIAVIGTAFVFMSVFLTGGVAQLFRLPYSPYDDLRGESVWDYVWKNISGDEVQVSMQPRLVTCFTLALFIALICIGISRKMMKEGPDITLAALTFGLCAVGAGLLHSYASLLFVLPAAMALPLLVTSWPRKLE